MTKDNKLLTPRVERTSREPYRWMRGAVILVRDGVVLISDGRCVGAPTKVSVGKPAGDTWGENT